MNLHRVRNGRDFRMTGYACVPSVDTVELQTDEKHAREIDTHSEGGANGRLASPPL